MKLKDTFIHAHKTIISVCIIVLVLGFFGGLLHINSLWKIIALLLAGMLTTGVSHFLTMKQPENKQ